MTSISIEQAQADFSAVIAKLKAGESLLITQDGKPVARLLPEPDVDGKQIRQPGSAVGRLAILVEDDEHLEDFAEYMS